MTQVLIIGLDGATFDLIKPWIQEGKLPNLAKLLENGVLGELKSTVPPMSPPAWTSFMTGKNPGKHGIFDFIVRKPYSYAVEFVNGRYRKATTLWQLMSEAGKRVCVLSIPITYPPEKLNGIMISGIDSPAAGGIADSTAIFPEEVYHEISEKLGGYLISPNFELYDSSQFSEMTEAALRTIERKMETAIYLLSKELWDCFMVTIGETDGIAHHLWKYHDRKSPLLDPNAAQFRGIDPLLLVYEKVDSYLGKICNMVTEDTTIVVMSDHGQGPNGAKAIYLNRWLEQQNFLKFKAGVHKNRLAACLREAVVKSVYAAGKVGLKVIPAALKKKLFRETTVANRVASWLLFSQIDWSGTKAYSEETPYFPSIRINVRGREPAGIVEPGTEYENVCQAVIRQLSAWLDSETGRPVVRKVHRREEIYCGPHIEQSPELIIEWSLDNGYSYLFKKSNSLKEGSPSISRIEEKEKQKSKSGDHRDQGIFVASGKNLRSGMEVNGAEIIDLAPTILYLLGLPVPSDMDGKVLTQILRDEYLNSHPIRYDNASGIEANLTLAQRPYTSEEEEAVRARLQGLGYLE